MEQEGKPKACVEQEAKICRVDRRVWSWFVEADRFAGLELVGRVDRAWEISFSWLEGDDAPRLLMSKLRRLSEDDQFGHAAEWGRRYAECSIELNRISERRALLQGSQTELLKQLRRFELGSRNYLAIRDPAAHPAEAQARRLAESADSGSIKEVFT